MQLFIKLIDKLSTKLNGADIFNKAGELILKRRYIINNDLFGLYLHNFVLPDTNPKIFHDHPWSWSLSIILSGSYTEFRIKNYKRNFKFLNINFIAKETFHRIASIEGNVWTLYMRGRKIKNDGFLIRNENNSWKYMSYKEAKIEYSTEIKAYDYEKHQNNYMRDGKS